MAAKFHGTGIAKEDALHLASAHSGGVDIFLTTDYDLIRKAKALGLPFEVMNPLEFAVKELEHEQDSE